MAYFDNAATTWPKPEQVYEYMDSFYRNSGGSAGRGSSPFSQSASALAQTVRKQLQDLLHCPAKQVIFTPTATIALNIILQGLLNESVRSVYMTPFEHNAVTRILHAYEAADRIKVHTLPVTENFEYDLMQTEELFQQYPPDLLVISHVSNVIGLIAPAEELCYLAKKFGAYTVIDMAQSAGLIDLHTGLETIDFAVFAGHKTLYGPTGISGFVMKPEIELKPVLYGGTGYDSANQDMPESLPERYEMGTLNTSGLAGLHAALNWIQETGIEAIRSSEQMKRKRLVELLSNYSFVQLVGPQEDEKVTGIVSFLLDGISSEDVGSLFAQNGISVRSGLQCAPKAHQFLKTYPAGTTRLSVSTLTSEEDFAELENLLNYIEENL